MLLSYPGLTANGPSTELHYPAGTGSFTLSTSLALFLFFLSLSWEQVVIRSEPTPTPHSNPFPPSLVFVLSGDLAPSHQSIRFTAVPPGSFWRCFHLIISLKKIFFSRAARGHRSHQSCFPTQWPFNQAEVHFAATLFRPPFLPGAQGWSRWPRPSESHTYQSFRGELGDLHQFPGI